jgi:hypothetical protein
LRSRVARAEFNSALHALCREKPPPTQMRVVAVAKLALEQRLFYKHIVHTVEKYVHKMASSSPQHLLGFAYVMDAICRRSQAKYADKDTFGARFALKLPETVALLRQCPAADRPQLDRVLALWRENNVIPDADPSARPGLSGSSSSNAAGSAAAGGRVSPPRTPPGMAPPANRGVAPPANLPPTFGGFGGPPPMLGGAPPMLGAPPMMGAPGGRAMQAAGALPPIDMDFNYDDDLPPVTEEALSDAKRRRLEEERRANERPAAAPAAGNEAQVSFWLVLCLWCSPCNRTFWHRCWTLCTTQRR